MFSNVPGTAREIVESLVILHDFTIKQIAEMLGVTTKTIYRIRRGFCPNPKTHLNLIQLYMEIRRQRQMAE